MKILFLSHSFYPVVGGIESNSEMLAEAFTEAGHEVHLLTWTKDHTSKTFSYGVIRNPNVITLLKEHGWADLVFENNPCLRLAWPNLFYKKPLVVVLNTWISRTDGRIAIQDKLKFKWLKGATSVIAVSHAVRRRCWPEAIVIGNPYKGSHFKIINSVERNKDFVFLGRLVSDKGADLAVLALHLFEEIIAKDKKLSLTIIGEGPEQKNLKQLTIELGLTGQVHFTGILRGDELAHCLNEHRYLLVPSMWEEPFGNVALEGMACGCLPIVSDGGGLPDAVGKAGLVFERGNVNDLFSCMKKLLKSPAKEHELRNQAPAHLEAHRIEKIAQKYLQVIERAMQPAIN